MIEWKNLAGSELTPDRRAQFVFLLMAGGLEFLLITVEGLFSGMGYFLVETYIILPGLLFFGSAVSQKQTKQAKWRLGLSLAMVLWFLVVQFQHKLTYGEAQPLGLFLPIYLLAFPFGAVTEDGGKNRGLTLIGGIFTAASLVLVLYSGLLLLDCVPQSMEGNVYWDGARLHPLWHSNIAACVFMIGIAFCLSFLFQARKTGQKVLWGAAIAVQFLAMALTNCRTTLLMTCALLGGTVFFVIFKGGWKRFILGLAAALVVMAASFAASGAVYDLHTENQIAKLTAQQTQEQEAAIAQTTPAQETVAEQPSETAAPAEEPTNQVLTQDQATGEVTITGNSGQGTLGSDLKTLNGRTFIWQSALTALENEPDLKLWGTEYVGLLLSVYNPFPVEHAHNSWMQVLMRMGVPGLVLALVFTGLAVFSAVRLLWRADAPLWKKILAMLELCLLVAGFLEPYLFVSSTFYHFIDFLFFFCLGYLDQWQARLRKA